MRSSVRRLVAAGLLLAAACLHAAPLRVGIDLDGAPMTFVDARGEPRGFAVEIMQAVAREMNFEVTFVAKPWAAMVDDFKAGRLDALANIAYTPERTRWVDFTAPHTVMTGAVFVRSGQVTIRRPIDLRDVRVAVKPRSAPDRFLEAHHWAGHKVPVLNLRDALRAVAEGRADAALDARVIGLKTIRDDHLTNLGVAEVTLPDFAQRLHAGFQPGKDQAVALYDDGLARLHADGTYDRIYEKWLAPLEPQSVRWRQLKPYFIPAALLLALVLGVFAWQRRLLRRMARQARALRQSEERLTLVLEGTEDGFWDWDLRTDRVERSARWAAMLGYSVGEIPPTLAAGRALIHPDDREVEERFAARLNPGEAGRSDVEYRLRCKSGEWRWVLNRGKVVARAPDGPPLRMAGTHTDITDLKQARERAARLEARFRVIYDCAPVGLSWMQRRQPDTRLVNPAYERITGVPAARSREAGNYLAATHPDDRARQHELQEQLDRGEIDHAALEKRYVHPDGAAVWAILTMHLFREPVSGEVHEVTTLVDITDRKRTEADRETLALKMLETQKLESLGVLAGGIAHDFNNLLTVILANATFAREAGAGGEEHLAPIETAARRAADLCRQMLAYAGKGSVLLEPVAVDRLVRETAELLKVSIGKKARLELALAPDLPAVEADASQLRQVVMNLVINAAEALGEAPGEIRLATSRGRPDAAPGDLRPAFDLPPGDCVCLEITDTGEGMSPGTIRRIFDPFFTTKFTGRGLGLAAVLGIVRAHHGALTVESAVGRGTTFRLYLPASLRAAAPAPALPLPPAAPATGRGTILVADDEPSVLATVDALLRRQGYRTVLTADGTEAVRRFRETPDAFAAALIDLTMPGRDGAEVLAAIRAERPFTRALVMSGFSEADILDRLRGLGEVVILRKPFTPALLLERLAEVIAAPGPE